MLPKEGDWRQGPATPGAHCSMAGGRWQTPVGVSEQTWHGPTPTWAALSALGQGLSRDLGDPGMRSP